MSRLPIAKQVAQDVKSASFIREMFEKGRVLKARFGEQNVFDYSLGNPTATPPAEFFNALRAVAAEMQPARHRYMPNAGFEDARAAVAAFISREYRLDLDAAGVILTTGAAGGLNVVLRTICDPGDEIIVLAPYFPEYRFYIQQAGGVMRVVETDDAFQPRIDLIDAAIGPRTRGILVNSPNNPSGAVYADDTCRALAALLARHDRTDQPLYLITDDPYRRILYDRDWCPTPVTHHARSLIVSSYSKDLSIPGERAGYIGVPASVPERAILINAMTVLNRTLGFVNAPALMQRVLARCAGAMCDLRNYRENRDLLCGALARIGYQLTPPSGALYAFPRTPIADDVRFAELLLEQKILGVPGTGFGRSGYIRLCYCLDRSVIEASLPGFEKALHAVR